MRSVAGAGERLLASVRVRRGCRGRSRSRSIDGWTGLTDPLRSPAEYLARRPDGRRSRSRSCDVHRSARRGTTSTRRAIRPAWCWCCGRWTASVSAASVSNLALVLAGGAASVAAVLVAVREVAGEAAATRGGTVPRARARARSGGSLGRRASSPASRPGRSRSSSSPPGGDASRPTRLALARRSAVRRRRDALVRAGAARRHPVVVAGRRRRLRPLVVAALGAVLVFAAFARRRILVARRTGSRPATEYLAGCRDPAAVLVLRGRQPRRARLAVGPAAAVGLARLRDRGSGSLVGGALARGRARRPQRHVEGRGRAHLAAVRPWVSSPRCAVRRDCARRPGTAHRLCAVGAGRDRRSPFRSRYGRHGDRHRPPYVLVVEDDPTVSEVVVRVPRARGLSVETAGRRRSQRSQRRGEHWPDLVVLDLMLPGIDGLEVCRRLRAEAAGPGDHAHGARRGGRPRRRARARRRRLRRPSPSRPVSSTARVKAVLRRATADRHRVRRPTGRDRGRRPRDRSRRPRGRASDGEPVSLTAREFDLLVVPRGAAPRTPSAARSCSSRSGATPTATASTVTVHVRRLREKLEDDPTAPTRSSTVWGVGYRWDP